MKGKLDWTDKKTINVFDEVTLWSAPFGRLLLENIPMKPKSKVLDLGFGTGFPLIELSQRFGGSSAIYGVDLWSGGIGKTREKIEVFGITNIEIFEQSAASIPLPDLTLDLITSNLGVNNFENREQVYGECFRVLKEGGSFCITTNPMGTFTELFEIFQSVFAEFDDPALMQRLSESIQRRGTQASIQAEIEDKGFKIRKVIADKTSFRFVDSRALFDHSLIRIGFLESWEGLVPSDFRSRFFERVQIAIDKEIDAKGEFAISVPMLYLEFGK